jgi:hypothetical protein
MIQAMLETGTFAWANMAIVLTEAMPHAGCAILLAF